MSLLVDEKAIGNSVSPRPTDDQIVRELTALAVRLKFIYGTGLAVQLALMQQNAEQDRELADCVTLGICHGAADLAESVRDLIERLGGTSPKEI